MAEAQQAFVPPTRSISDPPANPSAPKLRDSCNACAISKVKCDKVKPVCGRCEVRGTRCEYLVTKRSGRKGENRDPNALRARRTSRLPSPETQDPNVLFQSIAGDGPCRNTPPPATLPSPAYFSTPGFPCSGSQGDDLFTSLLSVDTLAPISPLNGDLFSQNLSFTGGLDLDLLNTDNFTDLQLPADVFCAPPITSVLQTPKNQPAPLRSTGQKDHFQSGILEPRHSHQSSSTPCSQKTCGCLTDALNQLQKVMSTVPSQTDNRPRESCGTVQSLIADNGRTVETIGKVLQCSCSQDCYLLSITSLVISKVLESYTGALQEAVPTHDEHPQRGLQNTSRFAGYCIDYDNEEGDHSRVAAQLVLGELQRVQRLISLLVQRARTSASETNGAEKAANVCGTRIDEKKDDSSSFSNTMLDNMGSDLRKRVRYLSLEIIELLRKE